MSRISAALAALLVAGSVAACSADPNSVGGQAQSTGGAVAPGLGSGGGALTQVPLAQRGAAVVLTGTDLDGTAWSAADHRGQVVVVNVWGSWCPPCVGEMPSLQQVWQNVSGGKLPVSFIGVDVRDSPASAAAFLRSQQVTYPSLRYDNGTPLLALGGAVPSVPTTLLLDRKGRIAARVIGPIDANTLTGLISDLLKESA